MTISDLVAQPALWGFLGAFVYASLKVSACIYDQDPAHGPRSRCYVEAGTALIVGTIGAAAFEPWLGKMVLHATEPQEARAISAVIGLLGNQVAPGLIKLMSDNILTRIKGGH